MVAPMIKVLQTSGADSLMKISASAPNYPLVVSHTSNTPTGSASASGFFCPLSVGFVPSWTKTPGREKASKVEKYSAGRCRHHSNAVSAQSRIPRSADTNLRPLGAKNAWLRRGAANFGRMSGFTVLPWMAPAYGLAADILPINEPVHKLDMPISTVVMPSRGAEGNGTVSSAERKAQALPVTGTWPAIAHAGVVRNDEPWPSAGHDTLPGKSDPRGRFMSLPSPCAMTPGRAIFQDINPTGQATA